MASSLQIKAETWAAGVLAAVTALAGVSVVKGDVDGDAANERVIVSAEVGERMLEGPRAYPVEIQVELRSTRRDAAAIDALFAAIETAFAGLSGNATALTAAAVLFDWLVFKDEEMTAEHERSGNTRERKRVFPFLIREKVVA